MSGDDYTDVFSLIKVLGHGGVGRVYLGFDKKIEREVAIKEIIPEKLQTDQNRTIARFIREAKITGRLEHPGIVPVYELNTKADGTIFYVMRYIKGRTLYDAIKDCASDMPEESFRRRLALLDSVIDVCDAVGYAHSKGIIHRDIKLSNIVLGEFGETIILDWGVAKDWREKQEEEISDFGSGGMVDASDVFATRDGAVLGTPSYMSPEQIDPAFGRVGPHSDVYAIGTILFLLLTGERPYREKGDDVMRLVASDAPSPSPVERCGFIPPELGAICEKAMSKRQEERFNNASEMAAELKAYRDGRLVSVYAYTRRELFRRFLSRNKMAISAAAAVIASILIGAGFAAKFAVDAHRARIVAEHALIDVTELSGSAMRLAADSARKMDNYFKNLAGGAKGVPKAVQKIDLLFPSIVGFDPVKSPFQIWCMEDDGLIVYDEDPLQVGKYLFTDAMYANFPELLEFGGRIKGEPRGLGYYTFLDRERVRAIHKIAAWETVHIPGRQEWKIIVTYPYIPAQ